MSKSNPKAKLLFDQYEKMELAERVAELEEKINNATRHSGHATDCPFCGATSDDIADLLMYGPKWPEALEGGE